MSASDEPRLVPARPLAAGEVVSLRAQGAYTVGSWYDKKIGPDGYPNSDPHGYNFKQAPFASAKHACAIALVGERNRVEGTVVGSSVSFIKSPGRKPRHSGREGSPSALCLDIAFDGLKRG
jgi:hypothetical protein